MIDGSSIAITNSGVVEGGDIGIFAAFITEGEFFQRNEASVDFPGDVKLELTEILQANSLAIATQLRFLTAAASSVDPWVSLPSDP